VSEFREVRLPADLCAEAEQKIGSKFASVDELLVFLLRELLRGDTAALDAAERQAVEQRLKDLGYI
jgi:Arc/MetJ-type ribon-helix-helix transcriptional regulator